MWRSKYISYETSKGEKEKHANKENDICYKGRMYDRILDHPA